MMYSRLNAVPISEKDEKRFTNACRIIAIVVLMAIIYLIFVYKCDVSIYSQFDFELESSTINDLLQRGIRGGSEGIVSNSILTV